VKRNEYGSSSGGGLLNGQLRETRQNVKKSQKTPASKAAGSSRPLNCKYAALARLSKGSYSYSVPQPVQLSQQSTVHSAFRCNIKNIFLIFADFEMEQRAA
jgi:hypothetical protein